MPILVGAGVPNLAGWGEVVSSFTSAVNIRHNRGLLVSLVQNPRHMTYLSVCVPSFFQNRGLATGDRVLFEGRRLAMQGFSLDLMAGPAWQGRITRKEVDGICASKISLLKEALLSKGRDGGFLGLLRPEEAGNPFVAKAREVLSGLQRELPGNDGVNSLSELVGLGLGSTPSGDDFIAGVLLGEETQNLVLAGEAKAVAGNKEPVIAWSPGKERLQGAMERTNDAGKTLLWQALQGRFPNYLIEAVRSLSQAKGKQEIDEAVERAVGRGATSGTDALVGFVFFMEGRL